MIVFNRFWKAEASRQASAPTKTMRNSFVWIFAFLFIACTPVAAVAGFFGDNVTIKSGDDENNGDDLHKMPPNSCNVTEKVANKWLEENIYVSSIKTNFEQLLEKWGDRTKDLFTEEPLNEVDLKAHKLPPAALAEQKNAREEFSAIAGNLFTMAKKFAATRYEPCTRCALMNDWGYLFYLTQNETTIRSFVDLNTLKYVETEYIKINNQAKIDDIKLADLTKAQIEDAGVKKSIQNIKDLIKRYKNAPADTSSAATEIKFGQTDRQATKKCIQALSGETPTYALCTKNMYEPLFKYQIGQLMIALSKVATTTGDPKLVDVRKMDVEGNTTVLSCLPITEVVTRKTGAKDTKPGLYYYTQFLFIPVVLGKK